MTVLKGLRQSPVEKCKGFINQTDFGKISFKISCDFKHFLVSSRVKWQPGVKPGTYSEFQFWLTWNITATIKPEFDIEILHSE